MAVNFAKLPELLRGPPPISGGELYGSSAPAGRTALRRQSDRRSAASIHWAGAARLRRDCVSPEPTSGADSRARCPSDAPALMPQRRRSESGAVIGLFARLEAPTSCLAANDVQGRFC
jgi:hypothetical protein